jgi:hypothetical protein
LVDPPVDVDRLDAADRDDVLVVGEQVVVADRPRQQPQSRPWLAQGPAQRVEVVAVQRAVIAVARPRRGCRPVSGDGVGDLVQDGGQGEVAAFVAQQRQA